MSGYFRFVLFNTLGLFYLIFFTVMDHQHVSAANM